VELEKKNKANKKVAIKQQIVQEQLAKQVEEEKKAA